MCSSHQTVLSTRRHLSNMNNRFEYSARTLVAHAGCRPVERTVQCEEHAHAMLSKPQTGTLDASREGWRGSQHEQSRLVSCPFHAVRAAAVRVCITTYCGGIGAPQGIQNLSMPHVEPDCDTIMWSNREHRLLL